MSGIVTIPSVGLLFGLFEKLKLKIYQLIFNQMANQNSSQNQDKHRQDDDQGHLRQGYDQEGRSSNDSYQSPNISGNDQNRNLGRNRVDHQGN